MTFDSFLVSTTFFASNEVVNPLTSGEGSYLGESQEKVPQRERERERERERRGHDVASTCRDNSSNTTKGIMID